MVKLSVIVPIYNAEQYLKECINSILLQTLKDIEIILIDDGSTDKSNIICRKLMECDKRISLYTTENRGVCAARNLGITKAKGEYVGFVDSDDYIAEEMYEKLYEVAIKFDSDMVMCDFNKITQDEKAEKRCSNITEGFYDKEKLEQEIYTRIISDKYARLCPINSQCFCIIKRQLIQDNKILYDESIKFAEDTLFASQVLYAASSFYYLKNEFLYNYRSIPGSRSKQYNRSLWEEYLKLCNAYKTVFEQTDYVEQVNGLIIYYAGITIQKIVETDESISIKLKEIRRIMTSHEVKMAFKKYRIPNTDNSFIWKSRLLLILLKKKMPLAYYLSIK